MKHLVQEQFQRLTAWAGKHELITLDTLVVLPRRVGVLWLTNDLAGWTLGDALLASRVCLAGKAK